MRPSSSDDEEANDLPVSLRTAMQSLRTRPVPRDALARSLTRAMALDARGDYEPSAIGRVRRSVRPWRGRSLRGALVVAVVLFVAALVPTAWRVSEPTTSWAQVVAAVHARPWIRYFEDVDDPRRLDMWCDQARQRFCYRREKWLHFANLRTRLYEIYDAEQNILTRAPLDSEGFAAGRSRRNANAVSTDGRDSTEGGFYGSLWPRHGATGKEGARRRAGNGSTSRSTQPAAASWCASIRRPICRRV